MQDDKPGNATNKTTGESETIDDSPRPRLKGFGPEWYQDKTRPEAIWAFAQMEESRRIMLSPQRAKDDKMSNQAPPAEAARVRFECLRLAHGERNRATAIEAAEQESPEEVIKRARMYAEFVLESES